ncbi:MAG: ABC transporter ATP-binding protein [Bdellovibrionia bacterium]
MLELKNLACGHNKNALLPAITESIGPGKIIFLVGKNGAGKTTLLKTLAGLLAPARGTVETKQRPIYLPAQVSVADTLTGLDVQEIYGAGKSPLRWAPPVDRPFATLSSGEQRQILLSATLSHTSPVVLLDEPFNFLDWNHTLELIEAISAQAKTGRAFLLATHHLDWILRFENTETWALVDTPEKNSRTILKGKTHEVLVSEGFQAGFGVRIQILKNPGDAGHMLAISRRN